MKVAVSVGSSVSPSVGTHLHSKEGYTSSTMSVCLSPSVHPSIQVLPFGALTQKLFDLGKGNCTQVLAHGGALLFWGHMGQWQVCI